MRRTLLTVLCICFLANAHSQVTNSVLATGNWYKIAIAAEGIYKLTYSDLQSLGINVSAIDPRNIRMYGNGGGLLPTADSAPRPDDLNELAIKVIGEADGKFDSTDYVLFYGQSQHRWYLDSTDDRYHHITNIYSDTTYYFLTIGSTPGKRISTVSSSMLTATDTVGAFDDYAYHELDSINFLKSGQSWYGEQFDLADNTRSFQFIFPNHVDSTYVNADVIGKSTVATIEFDLSVNGSHLLSELIPTVPSCYFCTYANPCSTSTSVTFMSLSDTLTVNLMYNSNNDPASTGWLNYLEVNGRRRLIKNSSQLFFRDKNSALQGAVSEFVISNSSNSCFTWDITDQANVGNVQTGYSSGITSMKLETDSLRSFVIFDSTSAQSAVLLGAVSNQNLHGMPEAEMIIITNPAFLSAANNLASQHRSFDGLTVNVATTEQIYNEFSSGSQDVTALRDFVRMFYKRAVSQSDTPRYVLLFGAASYDYKHRLANNSNFVPTYESANSLDPTGTFCSDDFFAWLDDNENPNQLLNLKLNAGVGRLPVRSLADANAMVNKIVYYEELSRFGNWRKNLVFVADEGDENIHFLQTENIAMLYDSIYCDFDQKKIYVDAYKEVGDTAFPDVNAAIYSTVDSGCLMISYVGQGGSVGWSPKKILTKPMIQSWNNINNLPFFVGSLDYFNLYDDPSDTSPGAMVVLNSIGGGIASWAGTRLTYSEANFQLMQEFYSYFLQQVNGIYYRIGDVIMFAKNAEEENSAIINIALLGDPAIRLKYPENDVVLTTFNGNAISGKTDTANLGTTISGTGEILNATTGLLMNGFTGNLHILLFRQITDTTLANDADSYVAPFNVWGDTLYNGYVPVSGGTFSFSFSVPAASNPYYRKSKISFYATDGMTDASGCYNSLVVGNIVQGIKELNNPNAVVTVFPNPVHDVAMFEIKTLQAGSLDFYLYDLEGRQIKSIANISRPDFYLNVKDLAKSIYMYSIENDKYEVIGRGKIVVQ